MHSTDALPLPPRPSTEQYHKLAKELAAAVKSGDESAVQRWAHDWMERLFRLSGADAAEPRRPEWIPRHAKEFAAYWSGKRTIKDFPPPQPTLAHAQFVIARAQGFASWAALMRHIDTFTNADSATARFEAAVDAIVTGDIATLRTMLHEHPELVREWSSRAHGCTLLHYISANGVEGYRQKTPPNIVAITRLLLEAGADVTATAHCYGSEDDTLGLTATSMHPHVAGVMIPLLETLVAAGAQVNHTSNGWGIIRACMANGQPAAARWLADHGAHLNLADALGVGRLDVARTFVAPDGALRNGATPQQLDEGFRNASWYGQIDAIRFLLDNGFDVTQRFEDGATGLHHAAYDGDPTIVELLLAHGAPLDVRESTYNGSALDWALWAWGADRKKTRDPEGHCKVVAMLRRAGATVKDAWYESDGGRQVMEKVAGDPRMQAALLSEGS